MTIDLRLGSREQDGVTVLSVAGAVDVASAGYVREAIDRLVDDAHPRLVVDLTEVTFIDSTGLGVLVGGVKVARRYDGWLRVVATLPRILRVFEITGLGTVFPVHGTVDEAVAAAGAAQG